MPKVFKMRHNVERIKKIELETKKYYTALPLANFEAGCICNHLLISHRENGECAYNLVGLCNCKQPIPSNAKLVCEITDLDIFEYEFSVRSERDSFEWWNEFNLWRIKNGV